MKKNSMFIGVIFFIVALFISLGTNAVQSAYENISEISKLLTTNAMSFEIQGAKQISGKDFLNVIQKEKDIYIQKDNVMLGTSMGQAIYFNSSSKIKVPLIQGRFFITKDFQNNKRIAVIGKNVQKYVNIKNKNKYINYEGQEYLVVGILGHKERSSNFDDIFYINLDSILNKSEDMNFISNGWIIDNKDNLIKKSFNNINEQLKKISKKTLLKRTYKQTSQSYLGQILKNRIFSIIITAIVVLVLVLNVVNTTCFYIQSKRKEIGIRKAFGARNFDIVKKIFIEYEVTAVKGFVCSQIIYFLIIKLKISPLVFGDYFYWSSAFVCFFIVMIIGILVALIPMVKSFKLQANEMMKGN